MTENQKTALKLILVVLLGASLGFSPAVHSVTQNARSAASALADKDYSDGAASLMAMAEAYPWWTSLWEQAGNAAFLAGDQELAVSAFEKARDLDALSENGRVELGRAYLDLGDSASAEQTWLSLPDSSAALQALAGLYESRGEIERAVEVWHDYLAQSAQGGQPGEVFFFGLLIASDTPPKALAYLDSSAADFPEAGIVAAAIRGALDEEPAYELVSAGQALASIGEWDLAAHAFERAVTLRPDYPEAWIYWGEALQHTQDPAADPLETLEQALSLDPESPLANLFIGLYWQRKGDHENALDHFQVVEAAWPDRADVLVEEGRSLAALGELEAALERFQAAVGLDPQNDSSYRLLAEFSISYAYSIREIGLPAARLAVQLAGEDPANLDVLGQALLALEDEMNAVKLFQQALDLDPGYAPASYHLGIIYSARGSREQAEYYLRQALDHSENPSLRDQAQRLLSNY